jgi:hypothetical protein
MGPVLGYCMCGNKVSGSVMDAEYLDCLNDIKVLVPRVTYCCFPK